MDLPDEKPRFISFHELYDSVGLSLFIVEKQTRAGGLISPFASRWSVFIRTKSFKICRQHRKNVPKYWRTLYFFVSFYPIDRFFLPFFFLFPFFPLRL